ncbi:glycosyltransferase family 2 protein [bacterium]|nr:glycosyltransferase family 2 protein [bacterium]
MLVSVVIPHLRGRDPLIPLLDDLARERAGLDGELEVILVDNASSDGSSQAAKETHPWIILHRLESNLGYAGGCNAGIDVATGDWIWLLNDDVRLDKGVIPRMLEVGESADDVAAVQPKVLSLIEKGMFDYAGGAGGMIDMFGYPFALGRFGGDLEQDLGQYDKVREIFWASGTACLWRRSTLDVIGRLDSTFFAHMEEIDLAWRAWNGGWRILSAPSGVVHHLGGGTLSYQAWRKMYLNHRNGLITMAKNREAGWLVLLLFLRFLLDNGVGLAEAVLGRPQRITAVWAGWLAFLWRTPAWLQERRTAQSYRTRKDRELRHVVYHGSILVAFARGVRSASAIVAEAQASP